MPAPFGLFGPQPYNPARIMPGVSFGPLPALTALTPAQAALQPILPAANPQMDRLADQVALRDAKRFGVDADPELVASMGPGLLGKARQMGGSEPAFRPGGFNPEPLTSTVPDNWNGSTGPTVAAAGTNPVMKAAGPIPSPTPTPAFSMAPPPPPSRPADEPQVGSVQMANAAAAAPSPAAAPSISPTPKMADGGFGPDAPVLPTAAMGGMGPDLPADAPAALGDTGGGDDGPGFNFGGAIAGLGDSTKLMASLLSSQGKPAQPHSGGAPTGPVPFDVAGYAGLLNRRAL